MVFYSVYYYSLCLFPPGYCQLTQEVVYRELQQYPLNGVLGVSDDGTTVYYGLDQQMGDILEEGTMVQGHCYKWLVALLTFCFILKLFIYVRIAFLSPKEAGD